ncbi:MAG TPA: hypothetical protein VK674_06750 [Candidatus Limnocylindria bacterium]|nr:hypothetical protein [Candidatus Limnocylindria bacterium]
MTEKLSEGLDNRHEQLDVHETSQRNLERLKEAAKDVEHDHSLDKLQESIHKTALSAKEITVGEHQQDAKQPVLGMQKTLKADAYKHTMQKVRSHLGPLDKLTSKVIHHRLVEPVSELSSKTIARPSGILGAGIIGFLGSGAVLYMAKRYGFRYNLTLFFLLIGSGFVIGLLAEVMGRVFRRKQL